MLNFNLTPEEQDLFNMAKDFGERVIKPNVARWDEEEISPLKDIYNDLRDIGFLGIVIPEEYGGQGGTYMDLALVLEGIAYYDPSVSILISGQNCVSAGIIIKYGTEEQKKKYLPKLAQGIDGAFGAFAMSEPGAGSDAASARTKAEFKDGNWVINGTKCFISGGTVATTYLVFAKTEKGLTCFIVDRDTPGFSVAKKETKMGIRGSDTAELVFDNVVVPPENMVGNEGDGFGIVMAIMDADRAGIAAMACGMAQRAIDEAVAYTKERVQFGKRISQFQNTQFVLAELQTKCDAARLMTYRAIMEAVNGEGNSMHSSMAKYFASDMVNDVSRRALQFLGGYGYSREYPMEKIMRDAKIFEIFVGTNEIQRMVISRAMGVK